MNTVSLTARQIGILRHASDGQTNAAIASKLGVSEQTVKTHLSRTYVKLGAKDRAHAVAIAMRMGAIS